VCAGWAVGPYMLLPALGRKLLASSWLRCTGRGGMCCINPVMQLIWPKIVRMLSRNRTCGRHKRSPNGCNCLSTHLASIVQALLCTWTGATSSHMRTSPPDAHI